MKSHAIFIFALVLTLFLHCINGDRDEKAATKIEAEVFFQPREQTSFLISPDGQNIAYIGIKNNHYNLFLRKIGKSPDLCLTNSDRNINRFYWGNKDFLLYLQDTDGDENYRLYRVNIHNQEIKCLTDFENVQVGIIDLLRTQDENIIIRMNRRDPELFDPYRLNIVTGALELLYENPGELRGWMTDNAGTIRFATADVLLYRKDAKSEFRKVIELGPDDVFDPLYFSATNDHVYAYSNIGRDKIAIVEFDPDTGKEVKVLFESPEYDAFGDDERDVFTYSPALGRLLFARYTAEKRELVFFDKNLEQIYRKLKGKIGRDYEINFNSFSDDLTRFIIHVSSDRVEGVYYYYDHLSGVLEKLHSDSPWLEEKELAEMKPIRFQARDGWLIHGYLTLPKGLKPKGLPVVVNPHAGPQWRNSWIFDLKTQFLANHGYAVLHVNFRGSEGYGKKFLRAGFRQWGLKMQDDITDGVNWLIDQGIADKHRIAIMGGSFGGYAALAGVTFTPDLYACGIDMWGIANYFTWYRSFPAYWKSWRAQINERWGDIARDSVQMYQTSPVFHVKQIKAPLLIFQGANDVRVKRGQSDEMVQALRDENRVVEYVLMPGEGHAVSDNQRLIDQMKKISDFLARHIGSR